MQKQKMMARHGLAYLPLLSNDKPLWAYANVMYALDETVTGAGY